MCLNNDTNVTDKENCNKRQQLWTTKNYISYIPTIINIHTNSESFKVMVFVIKMAMPRINDHKET